MVGILMYVLIYNWVNILKVVNVITGNLIWLKGGEMNKENMTIGNNIIHEGNSNGGRGNSNIYIHIISCIDIYKKTS